MVGSSGTSASSGRSASSGSGGCARSSGTSISTISPAHPEVATRSPTTTQRSDFIAASIAALRAAYDTLTARYFVSGAMVMGVTIDDGVGAPR
jgi:hypothetical protein